MAKRILVPLDRTVAAEAVLPVVADAARGAGAIVRLLHVAPIPELVVATDGHVLAYTDQEMARIEGETMDYLAAQALRLGDVTVDRAVRFGDIVDEILREAEAFDADQIALTTGHHGGLSHLLLGSTAEQVCRRTPLPVVIVKPAPDANA